MINQIQELHYKTQSTFRDAFTNNQNNVSGSFLIKKNTVARQPKN